MAATVRPMRPQPTMPIVMPANSTRGRFAVAEVGLPRPVAAAHFGGVMCHVLREIQQVRENHLGHRAWSRSRYVGHQHVVLRGRLEIDHVVAGGQHADAAQTVELRDGLARQKGLVGQQDVGAVRRGTIKSGGVRS